jgi:Protein  of unknown function (DUF3018)
MARKGETINLRIDPALKAEFMAATKADKKPVAEILRELMNSYIAKSRRKKFTAEARRQSQLIMASPDEAEVMKWIHNVSDVEGWK